MRVESLLIQQDGSRRKSRWAATIKSGPRRRLGSLGARLRIRCGPAIFAEQHCATCHSIADAGNPRSPLDGVGDRHGLEELRMWITGTGVATSKLPAAIAKRKQRYQTMPEDDLRALVASLAGLKAAAR